MQILVVAATELEIAPFKAENGHMDILLTGVGSPEVMYQLHKRVQQIDYDLVIQAGIAGSFDPAIPTGTVVTVKQDVFADLGIMENGNLFSLPDMGFASPDHPPYRNGWLVNDSLVLDTTRLPQVKAITVNLVSDDLHQSNIYRQKYRPAIESMEGAAFHYVCLQEMIPFIQLRSISNMVGERDKSKWELKKAVEQLNATLGELIQIITLKQGNL